MPDWSEIINSHHSKAHVNDGYRLVTGPPASENEFDALQESLGFQLPAEFKSFYSVHDGFGVAHENNPDITHWFFRPLELIEPFANDVRKWFQDTHEEYALRFFPFIDFGNGDGMGYVLDEAGVPHEGLFCFNHEAYQFDNEQDVNDFLEYLPISLQDFLAAV